MRPRSVHAIALLTLMPVFAGAACPPKLAGDGIGSIFDASESSVFQCLLPFGDGRLAAVGTSMFAGSARCGECLRVTGPEGSVVVRVVQLCGGCSEDQIELSEPAFASIADPLEAVADISWTRVACPVSEPVSFVFQNANPFYVKLQVREHRYGIESMSLIGANDEYPMSRVVDNFFEINPSEAPVANVAVRITATTGESLVQNVGATGQVGPIPGTAQFEYCTPALFADGFEPST